MLLTPRALRYRRLHASQNRLHLSRLWKWGLALRVTLNVCVSAWIWSPPEAWRGSGGSSGSRNKWTRVCYLAANGVHFLPIVRVDFKGLICIWQLACAQFSMDVCKTDVYKGKIHVAAADLKVSYENHATKGTSKARFCRCILNSDGCLHL